MEARYKSAPLQVFVIQQAEAPAYLGRHLVDWVASCGAAAVLLGAYMNDYKRGRLAVGVDHVRIQSATTIRLTNSCTSFWHMQDKRSCAVLYIESCRLYMLYIPCR